MNVVTNEDLEKFRVKLLEDLKPLLGIAKSGLPRAVRYIKSNEVMQEFQISQTKLYEMRRNNLIPCMKVGGQYLYNYDELVEFFKKSIL